MRELLGSALVVALVLACTRVTDADECLNVLHPAMTARIQKDVAWLDRAGGITDAMIRNISLLCDNAIRWQCNVKAVRMMIKDGEVYLNSLHPDWRLGPHELIGFLLELYEASKMYKLPDVEFAYNGDDDVMTAVEWKDEAALKPAFHGGPFPLLTWSKGDDSSGMLVPYSGAFRCADDSFDAMSTRLEDFRRVPWSERKQVAFGRWNEFCALYYNALQRMPNGREQPCPRNYLSQLSDKNLELLDVGVMLEMEKKGRVGHVPLTHQNVYRYLVSTDGWAISSKFDKYLLLGSLVIKARSPRYGFYYDALVPDQHFLPCMNASNDDVLERIKWAKEHDAEAQKMAEAAQAFAVKHLHRGARLCYYRTLMEELGKRMKYTPDCANRQLCIPLGQFLNFLSTYPKTRHTCPYSQVLSQYGFNAELEAGKYTTESITALLKQEKYWPRDTDIPPLTYQPYFPRRLRRRGLQARRRQAA
ncbi:hypothetical protein CHLRE_11g467670v5 [Chlamydomonas reinhardtii]|uniref:Glycosyl transferase CAP10 domain-containing protein n=1 Tax=Chlamydomonas reinhardtii TaxID=3055 RepID=A0A2K3D7M4_CHLRE|nr:uncharacterized protein CHLRE_11g467670v5 [Chlamydomonas reinhardtii]PNW76532.1 hypothetical protein CHLRE_11g467670v5 [Chlamydomonas reinhardtii]